MIAQLAYADDLIFSQCLVFLMQILLKTCFVNYKAGYGYYKYNRNYQNYSHIQGGTL